MTPEDRDMLPPDQWALGKWIEAKFDDAFARVDSMRTDLNEYRDAQAEHRRTVDERLARIETAALKAAGKGELKAVVGKRFVAAAAMLGGIAGFASLFINHG